MKKQTTNKLIKLLLSLIALSPAVFSTASAWACEGRPTGITTMKMTVYRVLRSVLVSFLLQVACSAQTGVLNDAEYFSLDIPVNDVVYDRFQNVLYASIPSSAGAPHANSIATINPMTGEIESSILVGDEPNSLAISLDASRVYVGIDGSRSMRWWQPADNELGPLRSLTSRFGDPALAHDLAVPPGRPNIVVVSADEVGSTANGDLIVFSDIDSARPGFSSRHSPNHIGFTDPTTLLGFDNSNTGFEAAVWNLDEMELSTVTTQRSVIRRFNNEAEVGSDDRLYFTNGVVLDDSLARIGTYEHGLSDLDALVEPVPASNLIYFVGPTEVFGSTVELQAYNRETYRKVDGVQLPIDGDNTETRGEMIIAGEDRLAFVWKERTFSGAGQAGTLHVVSGIPVQLEAVPDPLDCNFDGVVNAEDLSCLCSFGDRGLFTRLRLVEGDLNADGIVGFADFLIMSTNYRRIDVNYQDGDIDCDGEVSFRDFLTLSSNFGSTFAGDVQSVPEPASPAILAMCICVMVSRIRRGRSSLEATLGT